MHIFHSFDIQLDFVCRLHDAVSMDDSMHTFCTTIYRCLITRAQNHHQYICTRVDDSSFSSQRLQEFTGLQLYLKFRK